MHRHRLVIYIYMPSFCKELVIYIYVVDRQRLVRYIYASARLVIYICIGKTQSYIYAWARLVKIYCIGKILAQYVMHRSIL